MPLSEHEQRLFEQIERSLAEDPKFASAVRASDPQFHARRRIIAAFVLVLGGLVLLVFGVGSKAPLLGVLGFVTMLGAVAFGIQAHHRKQNPELRVVGGSTSRKTRSARKPSLVDRLEERWRRRPDQGF